MKSETIFVTPGKWSGVAGFSPAMLWDSILSQLFLLGLKANH
jgi:hypothetical protein